MSPLLPIPTFQKHLDAWKSSTGNCIDFEYFDLSEHYHRILTLFEGVRPQAVIHFAEQRAAHYSMKWPFLPERYPHTRHAIVDFSNGFDKAFSFAVPQSQCPSRGGWFVGALAKHGNPYDGHTLADACSKSDASAGIRSMLLWTGGTVVMTTDAILKSMWIKCGAVERQKPEALDETTSSGRARHLAT